MFALENISKNYGEVAALRSVSLKMEEGKTTAIIGPSGCGKSTMLHLLNGIELPTGGDVRFEGEPLPGEADLPQVRKRIGYVIQEGGLFAHLTARGNVTLVANLGGQPPNDVSKRVEELRALVQLEEGALDRYPSQLSGGQRQRVGLMRALMLDPPALLMDEPLGSLDPLTRSALQSDLKTIFAELEKTVVIVTHDLAEASFLAHRIVLLNKGEIAQIGTMTDLIDNPASDFVRHFVHAQRTLMVSP